MLEEKYVFIDECGNTNLDVSLSNVGTHYVITAVIVNKSDLKEIETGFEKIRVEEFQKSEMKSSKVGSNDQRRIRILKRLAEFPFRIYCLPINKQELKSEGYEYEDVFYKNLNAKLHRIIFRDFSAIKAYVDECKTTEFMNSFKAYLAKKIVGLFPEEDIAFVDSKKSIIVQAADFIGGSIARHFDKTFKSSNPIEFLKILNDKKRIVFLEEFPPYTKPYIVSVENEKHSQFDKHIQEYAFRNAYNFINENSGHTDENISNQVLCIKILLRHHYFHPNIFLPGHRLREEINESLSVTLTEHQFHSTIIASLRDKDIIISSSHDGYKLPTSLKDIYCFLNLVSSQFVPLLSRVDSCRKALLRITNNELDVLKQDGYEVLHKALEGQNIVK